MGLFLVFMLSLGHLATPVAAQDDSASKSVTTIYSKSYTEKNADITRPVTIEAENHLYYPGEQVSVSGSVWIEIIESVQALNDGRKFGSNACPCYFYLVDTVAIIDFKRSFIYRIRL